MQAYMKYASLSAVLFVTACTTNPYTGEKQASKAAVYGASAAVVCGLIGATESSKRARNAAAGCGAIGAGVGAYMDVQEAKLRQELQGSGVSVVRDGDNIRLILPSNITFPTDSYRLKEEFYPVLRSVSQVLAKYNDTTLRVTGHTDSTGSDKYNQQLSEKRAQSVASGLEANQVAGHRLYVEGAGKTQPIADNNTESGRATNRRVELYILPKV